MFALPILLMASMTNIQDTSIMSTKMAMKTMVIKLIVPPCNKFFSSISVNERFVIPKTEISTKPPISKAFTNLFFLVISCSPTASSNLRATLQYFSAKIQKTLDVAVTANV